MGGWNCTSRQLVNHFNYHGWPIYPRSHRQRNEGEEMNIPEGWPTEEMIEAAWRGYTGGNAIEKLTRAVTAALAAAPTPPDRHRADCSVVCLASQDDGIICPYDSCDIEDGTRGTPTPPAQAPNCDKDMKDYNEPAMNLSWQYLRTQLGSEGWTTSEAVNYKGFFAWGWEARRQHNAPAQKDEPVGFIHRPNGLAYEWQFSDELPVSNWIKAHQ